MIRSPRDLNELCHWYECEDHNQAQCGYCQEGEIAMNDQMGREDVIRFSLGREVTGQELIKHSAGRTLTALAKQHAARKNCSFQEALHAVSKICPGEVKSYLNLRPL